MKKMKQLATWGCLKNKPNLASGQMDVNLLFGKDYGNMPRFTGWENKANLLVLSAALCVLRKGDPLRAK